MTSASTAQQFDRVVEDLTAEFNGTLDAEVVIAVVAKFREELEPSAKIAEYLPVLVRRFAREELVARSRRLIAV